MIPHSRGFVICHYQEVLWFITQEVLWFFNIKRLCDVILWKISSKTNTWSISNKFLTILVLIFEYITILKQLPHFSSCRVFGTYPGFETITRIHINVKFQAFAHLRIKTRFFDKVKYKKQKTKILFFYDLKSLWHREIKILILFCSFNIDLTRNQGNGLN